MRQDTWWSGRAGGGPPCSAQLLVSLVLPVPVCECEWNTAARLRHCHVVSRQLRGGPAAAAPPRPRLRPCPRPHTPGLQRENIRELEGAKQKVEQQNLLVFKQKMARISPSFSPGGRHALLASLLLQQPGREERGGRLLRGPAQHCRAVCRALLLQTEDLRLASGQHQQPAAPLPGQAGDLARPQPGLARQNRRV